MAMDAGSRNGWPGATCWAVTEQLLPAPLLLMVQFSADAAAAELCALTSTRSSINITTAEHRARDCAMAAALPVQQCAAVGKSGNGASQSQP